jgi:hypothetical protein
VQGVERKRREKERGEKKMCLQLVSERVERPKIDVEVVYKVFSVVDNKLVTDQKRVPVVLDEWQKADTKKVLPTGTAERYRSGFHGWVTNDGAKNWASYRDVIVPVYFRKVRTRGKQIGHDAIVADEMFVPKAIAEAAIKSFNNKKKRGRR